MRIHRTPRRRRFRGSPSKNRPSSGDTPDQVAEEEVSIIGLGFNGSEKSVPWRDTDFSR